MDKEFETLEYISLNEKLTQRKLAEKVGLSLGAVNILLKKLVKKGLIKIDQINGRTIRYLLTPKGIAEKTRKTYEYVLYSYKYISTLNTKVKNIVNNNHLAKIYVFGKSDEIYNIINNAISEVGKIAYRLKEEELNKIICSNEHIILTWDIEYYTLINNTGLNVINIIE